MNTRILVTVFTLTVALGSFAIPLHAAISAGTLRGVVTGPDGQPMPGVPLILRNDITGFKAQAVTDANGRYSFFNVPFNPYELHVEVQGFATQHLAIDVRSTSPVEQPVALKLESVSASVKVEAEKPAAVLETDSSQSHVDIDKSSIQRAPAASPSRGMESLIIQAPGFSQDENGRYHFQGAHSQQSYVVDGQPISDQIGTTFSNSIDPGILQSAEVIYGNVPAEYGEKIAAVINLTTKSGLGTGGPHGDVHAGGAQFKTYDAGASVGGGTSTFGYFGSVDASKSDRFLDPVNFDNFHNHGDTERAFLRLDGTTPQGSDSFRLSGLIGRTNRDVTNTFTEEATNTDNTVETNDWNANAGWQHVFGSSAVLDTTLFARNNRFTYRGSPNDPSVITNSKRSLDNYGVQPTLSIQAGAVNELKFGAVFKSYPIQERFSFGLTDPALNDPGSDTYNPNLAPYDLTRGGTFFQFDESKTITYLAGFVEDTIRLSNFTAQVGLRYDHNSFPLTESQLQPRVGIVLLHSIDENSSSCLVQQDFRNTGVRKHSLFVLGGGRRACPTRRSAVARSRGRSLVRSFRAPERLRRRPSATGRLFPSVGYRFLAARRRTSPGIRISFRTRGLSFRWRSNTASSTAGTFGWISHRSTVSAATHRWDTLGPSTFRLWPAGLVPRSERSRRD